jgi:hypothetical protein
MKCHLSRPLTNRSHKKQGDQTAVNKDAAKVKGEVNTSEQGETANIKQNTTNAGFFKGRRSSRAKLRGPVNLARPSCLTTSVAGSSS